MTDYHEMRRKVATILKESGINTFDFVRIAKDLCTCKTCKFFIQHYDKDGKEVDLGHCIKGNAPRARKPYQSCCGSWDVGDNNEV